MSFAQMYWIIAGLVVILTLSALLAWSLRQVRRDLQLRAPGNRTAAKGGIPSGEALAESAVGPPGRDNEGLAALAGATLAVSDAPETDPSDHEPPSRKTWAAAIPFSGRRGSASLKFEGGGDPAAGVATPVANAPGSDAPAGVADLGARGAPLPEAGTSPGLSALHTAPLVLNPEELESGLTSLDEDHILRLSALEDEVRDGAEEETATREKEDSLLVDSRSKDSPLIDTQTVEGAPLGAWPVVADHLARAGALGWMALTGEGILLGSDQAYDARVVERFGRLAAEAARSGALVGLSRPGRFTLRGDEGLVYMVSVEDLEAFGSSTGLPEGTWIVAFLENNGRHPDPVWESLFVSPARPAVP